MKLEVKSIKRILSDEKKVSAFFIVANLFVLLILLLMCFNKSVWIDETFDLEMIKHPYSYFLFTFRDAAPPFHFFVLKVFVDGFGKILPFLNYLYIAKFCSLVPYIIICIISNTYVRNKWGMLVGALSGLLSITMPVLFGYGIEVRQYSWAILLAYIWFLSFYEFVVHESVRAALIMTVLGPLSLLAHYFIVFGIIYAYFVYCIYNIVKKNYKGVRILLGVSFGSILLFVPWLVVSFKAIVGLAKNFWISQVTLKTAAYSFIYPFVPDASKFRIDVLGAIALITILLYMIVALIKAEPDSNRLFVIIGLTMPFVISLIGDFIGRFVASVFQPRYVMPVMACFWLSWSIVVAKYVSSKNIKIAIVIVLMVIAALDVSKNVRDEVKYKNNLEILSEFMKQDIVITAEQGGPNIAVDDGRVYNCLSYYTDKPYYGIGGSLVNDYRDLVNRTKAGEEMYLIHSVDDKTNQFYVEDMQNQGIKLEKVVYCGIEYIDLVIYRLRWE